MKRGWIAWDRNELPTAVLNARVDKARHALAELQSQALLVYTDVWRSNSARYLTNFMPYWNRSLVVIPAEDSPVLLCGLSARVYPWIRTVSNLEDIWPAARLAEAFLMLCSERSWTNIAVLDLDRLPHGISAPLRNANVRLNNLPSQQIMQAGLDETELSMRRHALQMAREILADKLAEGRGRMDHEFTGRLERAFRRRGVEDLMILSSDGFAAPAAARGVRLANQYSVVVALEYRGHWVRLARTQTEEATSEQLRADFGASLADLTPPTDARLYLQDFAGPYPYQSCDRRAVGPGTILCVILEIQSREGRLLYGDTCRSEEQGTVIL